MSARLVQNFKGGRAFIVTATPGLEGALAPTLARLGVESLYPRLVNGRAEIPFETLRPERDMLFVDGDLEGAVGLEQEDAEALPPVPVIGLVGVEAPSRLKALVHVGATAFLRKPVHGGAVYAALFMGINQFQLRSQMCARFEALQARQRGRRFVFQATLQVMARTGLDEDQAYAQLRHESMRTRQALEVYCEDFVKRHPKTATASLRSEGAPPRPGKPKAM
ncbi:ANTAR domain-containing response regulator [Azorhizobium caulinodans]|uniref:ANTAR domain-containing response regulator n=1 Tax=Azorhizobium caulinodans TaxID=7 RepID=UPI002FBD5C61